MLTLGRLVADDEAVHSPRARRPLQQSSGVCHVHRSELHRRGGHCRERIIDGPRHTQTNGHGWLMEQGEGVLCLLKEIWYQVRVYYVWYTSLWY